MQVFKKLPFRVYIFCCLSGLIFAFAIGIWQFQNMGQIILDEANSNYSDTGRYLASAVQAIYTPAKNQTEILAESMPVPGTTIDARLRHTAYLAKTLSSIPSAKALFVGYASGEFFLLRKHQENDTINDDFVAPAGTEWLVYSTNFEHKILTDYILSFNAKLQETSRKKISRRNFDPRNTLWYQSAVNDYRQESDHAKVTKPYFFFSNHQIGITYSEKIADADAVIGIDIELPTLLETLTNNKLTPSSRVALVDENAQILAMQRGQKPPFRPKVIEDKDGTLRLPSLLDQDANVLKTLFKQKLNQGTACQTLEMEDITWATYKQQINVPGGQPLTLLIASPHRELLSEITAMRKQSVIIFAVMFGIAVMMAIWFSKRISQPILQLAEEANKIAHFDFNSPVKIDSPVNEISALSLSMTGMRSTIHSFLDIASNLAAETNFDTLLGKVLRELSEITIADAAILYLYDPKTIALEPVQRFHDHQITAILPTSNGSKQCINLSDSHPLAQICNAKLSDTASNNISSVLRLDTENVANFFGEIVGRLPESTLISVPLRDRKNQLVGAIALFINARNIDMGRQTMAEAVSGTAAVAIENQRLIQEQKALIEAFIQVLATAIDAKNPITGGHCQRLPLIAKSLALAACNETTGVFADFNLTEAEWEELHVAAWLHDCGKITTPEYVIDKATKLETLYDRIHEVRMRFEVIKRELEIDYWKAIAAGGNADVLKPELIQALADVDDDFSFIATCNTGGEFLSAEKIARIDQISERRWKRTLSDRIGISDEERQRKNRTPDAGLPVIEKVLDDKAEHIFMRDQHDIIPADNQWGFNIKVPEYLYNRGELVNLKVVRGTLSEEERYKINEHIIHTIMMLTQLPFPRHLSRVPEIAGGHHEKINGTGYPKGLHGKDMGTTAKIMAIADIFEALTAADRPYKKGKTLSEAIKIMSFMQRDQHIDSELFALFLRSGVYLDYAKLHMRPEQIDQVDIQAYL